MSKPLNLRFKGLCRTPKPRIIPIKIPITFSTEMLISASHYLLFGVKKVDVECPSHFMVEATNLLQNNALDAVNPTFREPLVVKREGGPNPKQFGSKRLLHVTFVLQQLGTEQFGTIKTLALRHLDLLRPFSNTPFGSK